MTREEAVEPFEQIQANWPFMDFGNSSLFEAWFATLSKYPLPEVLEGIRNMIANEKSTPNAAVAREYVDVVRDRRRREERDHNLKVLWDNSVHCTKCNDYGYTMRVYPAGYEYMIPCDCAAAKERFTEKWRTGVEQEFSKERIKMLFGTDTDAPWKLVRYVPERGPKHIIWRYERK